MLKILQGGTKSIQSAIKGKYLEVYNSVIEWSVNHFTIVYVNGREYKSNYSYYNNKYTEWKCVNYDIKYVKGRVIKV